MLDATGQNVLMTIDSGEQFLESTRPTFNDAYGTGFWLRFAEVVQPPAGTRTFRVRLLPGSRDTCWAPVFSQQRLQALDSPIVSVGNASGTEGDAGSSTVTFDVNLGCVHDLPVTVDYFTADGTATAPGDYAAAQGQLTFVPGETAKTVGVEIQGDTLEEGNETFSLFLGAVSEAAVVHREGIGTIFDDEAFVSISGRTVLEGNSKRPASCPRGRKQRAFQEKTRPIKPKTARKAPQVWALNIPRESCSGIGFCRKSALLQPLSKPAKRSCSATKGSTRGVSRRPRPARA